MRERWIGDSPKSLFPRRSTNCPALYASCGRARERRRPVTSRRGFPTFTMPSLAPLPPPAASPRFIVHLSCFTLLEQQSSLTRQITGRGNEEEKSVLRSSSSSFLEKCPGWSAAGEIVDLFIYPRCGRSHGGSTWGVIFILQTLNKARPRRSTLETAY